LIQTQVLLGARDVVVTVKRLVVEAVVEVVVIEIIVTTQDTAEQVHTLWAEPLTILGIAEEPAWYKFHGKHHDKI
tara:strand:+ start:609 stop:833 length:225 start_codon:yes stop_codon:yes gene_type:complete